MDDKTVDAIHLFNIKFETNPKYRWLSSDCLSSQIIDEYLAEKPDIKDFNTLKSTLLKMII